METRSISTSAVVSASERIAVVSRDVEAADRRGADRASALDIPSRRRSAAGAGTSRDVRTAEHNRAVLGRPYTAVSLYSGAGGLDAGFLAGGFRLLWAIDCDRHAVDTYRTNLGQHIVCGDVLGTQPPPELMPDVVIGGPPCQGFSVIGRMDPADPRSRHVFHFRCGRRVPPLRRA